jgi:hypothetical protein
LCKTSGNYIDTIIWNPKCEIFMKDWFQQLHVPYLEFGSYFEVFHQLFLAKALGLSMFIRYLGKSLKLLHKMLKSRSSNRPKKFTRMLLDTKLLSNKRIGTNFIYLTSKYQQIWTIIKCHSWFQIIFMVIPRTFCIFMWCIWCNEYVINSSQKKICNDTNGSIAQNLTTCILPTTQMKKKKWLFWMPLFITMLIAWKFSSKEILFFSHLGHFHILKILWMLMMVASTIK